MNSPFGNLLSCVLPNSLLLRSIIKQLNVMLLPKLKSLLLFHSPHKISDYNQRNNYLLRALLFINLCLFLTDNTSTQSTPNGSYSGTWKNRQTVKGRPDGPSSFHLKTLNLKKIQSAHGVLGTGTCSRQFLRTWGCPENKTEKVGAQRQKSFSEKDQNQSLIPRLKVLCQLQKML